MGCGKYYFQQVFIFFIFPNFKWLLWKVLCKNHLFLQWILRVLIKFYYVLNMFGPHTFDIERTALLKIFEISTKTYFISLVFLNEKNIKTSLLIYWKCVVVHYRSLNSSSINKPYLWVAFIKNFMKKLSFLINVL